MTIHRAENVDDPGRLANLLEGLHQVEAKYQQPIIFSVHPHTADKMQRFGLGMRSERIRLLRPLGFFDFVKLERNARCVLSHSGTVQEECCIFGVCNVTIRDVTERPETIECGSNILTGAEPGMIVQAVDIVLNSPCDWTPPAEYVEQDVSTAVAKIVLGYRCQPCQR